MAKISEIEGIGPTYAEKLAGAGIETVEALLEEGAKPAGRERIADASGVPEKALLRWVNMADLFRIRGVGEEYADLLERAGVDTVVELSRRNAENLHEKMKSVNEEASLVRALPSAATVEKWVAQAKELPRGVFF
ncbi:MAG: DUF4332 domain-containing protein [Myxococcota bacterium]|nr:DUF4332 domain-containing protein [Myxococcota bacterium]